MRDITTLDEARQALEKHAWQEAYEGLTSLASTLTGEDLERLGEAAWWSAHPTESLDAFERAYAAHVAEGNPRRAAYVALRLGIEHADRMESALWNGWLQRATRLLADQPACVEQGFLELALVRSSLERGAVDEAMEHLRRLQEIGGRFGNQDLIAFGQVLQGGSLVHETQIERGFALIDEGTLAAVGGELTPYAAGNIYCITIAFCRAVADYGRAAQWTDAVARWCEREAITGFPGICKVQRAEIMRLRGSFADAEDEARKAAVELSAFGRLPQAGAASDEIGQIRLRLGDLDGAQEAFEQAHQLGHEPQPGLALLHLARGRPTTARASIKTALADAQDPLLRARLLPARVEIAVAVHDVTDARAAADELHGVAESYDMPMLHAAAHQAQGTVLVYEEDASAAIAELRKAVRLWTELDAPFEAAQARRCLAIACRSAGDEASAGMELRAAKAAFDRLAARLESERCDDLIRVGREGEAGRRVTRTFMFTDIVGSTDLVRTIGDDAWKDILRWHDDTLRTMIGSHRGEVVHSTGDGFFASFEEASAAVSCAVDVQRRLADHRRQHGFAPKVRIGLHAAEATVIAGDYAGLGVHQAARVGSVADGGEILVTTETLESATVPFEVTNPREVSLKGLDQPVRVATIDWKG